MTGRELRRTLVVVALAVIAVGSLVAWRQQPGSPYRAAERTALEGYLEARQYYEADQDDLALERVRQAIATPLKLPWAAPLGAAPDGPLARDLEVIQAVASRNIAASNRRALAGRTDAALLAARLSQRMANQLLAIEPPGLTVLLLAVRIDDAGEAAEAEALSMAGMGSGAARVTARLDAKRAFAAKRIIAPAAALRSATGIPPDAAKRVRALRDDWRLRAPGR